MAAAVLDRPAATAVEMTPAGRELMPKMRAVWRQAAEAIAAGLPPGQLDQLMDSLEMLRNAFDPDRS
ncbi:hypothetical protein [Kribbella lupini]|uniref:HTH marR-type domain-containing protein n=1 Tax=Kribbella lupini TaxID=291602 RepID=A0ABN2CKV1_9ACTN